MAAASAPLGVSLQEATQRRLRRFSELRGTKEGTPALLGKEQGGCFSCWDICWTSTSFCGPRALVPA